MADWLESTVTDDTCSLPECDRARRKMGYCEVHYQRLRRRGALPPASPPRRRFVDRTCTVDGCVKQRQNAKPYCPMHRARMRRHGDVNAVRPNRRTVTVHTDGYLILNGSTHPLVDSRGSVYAHRAALFDAIGPGEHACHWCGRVLHWKAAQGQTPLVVDHVDANKQNNDPSNLVPSCAPCNTKRVRHYKLDRTHCANGHEYTPDNLLPPGEARRCRTCRDESWRRSNERRHRRTA